LQHQEASVSTITADAKLALFALRDRRPSFFKFQSGDFIFSTIANAINPRGVP
jgi:hypothetical protein